MILQLYSGDKSFNYLLICLLQLFPDDFLKPVKLHLKLCILPINYRVLDIKKKRRRKNTGKYLSNPAYSMTVVKTRLLFYTQVMLHNRSTSKC